MVSIAARRAGWSRGQRLVDGLEQLLQRDGLFEERLRADAGGFDGGVDGGVATHHDDRHGQQTGTTPLLEQGDAVGVWHPDVEQHQVGASVVARGACLCGILGEFDGVPLVIENLGQQIPNAEFVVNHQDVGHKQCGSCGSCCSRSGPCGPRMLAGMITILARPEFGHR
jgi:hypothetical protein